MNYEEPYEEYEAIVEEIREENPFCFLGLLD